MGIFAKLDAANIPSNPFFIPAGEYAAEVTDAKVKISHDGKRQLVITYTITDEESEYFGRKASKYFDLVDPDLTEEALSLLPAEDRRKINQSISSMKRSLCGDNRNKGLGIDPDDLNDDDWSPETLKGVKVDLAINNYGPDNEGINVRWANVSE